MAIFLNPQQQAAVYMPLDQHALILAGAGTGKTRVLIERIAHLLETGTLYPSQIWAITFTRKAAGEIVERLVDRFAGTHLEDEVRTRVTMGTFHRVFLLVLRRYLEQAKLKPNFTICEPRQSEQLVKQKLKDLGIERQIKDTQFAKVGYANLIATLKENLITPDYVSGEVLSRLDNLRNELDFSQRDLERLAEYVQKVYAAYDKHLHEVNAVDFADILLRSYQLLQAYPQVRAFYKSRIRLILVDECQDLNLIQYELLRLLGLAQPGEENLQQPSVCFIGDDDQSIYGFRGADIELIERFQLEFGAVTYKLEENYRCSPNILAIANTIINKHKTTNVKTLVASKQKTDNSLVYYHLSHNLGQQVEAVLNTIKAMSPAQRAQCAILCRTNRGLDEYEKALMYHQIPHHRLTGRAILQRAEILDAIAYLKVVLNPTEDLAFARIVNKPARGIGNASQEQIINLAHSTGIHYLQAFVKIAKEKNRTAWATFATQIMQLHRKSLDLSLFEVYKEILATFDISSSYKKEADLSLRQESLEQFAQILRGQSEVKLDTMLDPDLLELERENVQRMFPQYNPSQVDNFIHNNLFLSTLALDPNGLTEEDYERGVALTTVHGAKGLEWEYVFVVGFHEGMMPCPAESLKELQEERRMCYVAVTRAKEQLMLCYAREQMMYGQLRHYPESTFAFDLASSSCDGAWKPLTVGSVQNLGLMKNSPVFHYVNYMKNASQAAKGLSKEANKVLSNESNKVPNKQPNNILNKQPTKLHPSASNPAQKTVLASQPSTQSATSLKAATESNFGNQDLGRGFGRRAGLQSASSFGKGFGNIGPVQSQPVPQSRALAQDLDNSQKPTSSASGASGLKAFEPGQGKRAFEPGQGKRAFEPGQGSSSNRFANQGFGNQGFGNQGFGNQQGFGRANTASVGFGRPSGTSRNAGNQGFGNAGNQGFGSRNTSSPTSVTTKVSSPGSGDEQEDGDFAQYVFSNK